MDDYIKNIEEENDFYRQEINVVKDKLERIENILQKVKKVVAAEPLLTKINIKNINTDASSQLFMCKRKEAQNIFNDVNAFIDKVSDLYDVVDEIVDN